MLAWISGIDTTVPLLAALLAESVVGWILWQRRRAGAVFACGTASPQLSFWIGFAPPVGLLAGVAGTAITVVACHRAAASSLAGVRDAWLCCAPAHGGGEIGRKVINGGSHLCAPSYCLRYRPAARQGQEIDSSTSHLGFRCVVRGDGTVG